VLPWRGGNASKFPEGVDRRLGLCVNLRGTACDVLRTLRAHWSREYVGKLPVDPIANGFGRVHVDPDRSQVVSRREPCGEALSRIEHNRCRESW